MMRARRRVLFRIPPLPPRHANSIRAENVQAKSHNPRDYGSLSNTGWVMICTNTKTTVATAKRVARRRDFRSAISISDFDDMNPAPKLLGLIVTYRLQSNLWVTRGQGSRLRQA